MIPGTKKSVASILDITNRKKVENELKVSKKLFDDLVEGSPAALFVVNTNHKIVYWNRELEKMTGLKADQMIGTKNHWKPFYREPTQMMTDMIIDGKKWKDILRHERYTNIEVEEYDAKNGIVCSKFFEDFHGGKKWLRFKIKPLYDINKNLVGAIEAVDDVTERREMRENLENRMREFQVLYQVNDHIRMIQPIHEVLRIIVRDIAQACDEIKPARARIVFDGKRYTNLKSGEKFAVNISESIVVAGEKRGNIELGYVQGVLKESSIALKHEKRVLKVVAQTLSRHVQHREVVERYQKLVNRSVVGIFIVQNGVFQYVNPKFVRIFKTKETDVTGKPFESLLGNCDCFSKFTKDEQFSNFHSEFEARRKDGVTIDVDVFTQVIDYYGKRAILGTLQDVTKLKEAQRRQKNFNQELKAKIAEKTKDLQVANRRLQSLNEIKDEFIAVTSHELRSPLTAARGYLSFLIDEEISSSIPEDAKDYLVRVYDNVEVLNNLVNNILDVSRIEMDRLELYRVPTDIVEMLKQVISNLRFQAAEKNITVTFSSLLDTDELILNVDQVRLRQVFRNILDNAIKYSYDEKPIHIEVEVRGIGVQISIVDHGQGIRQSEIFNIFEKFKQAKNKHAQYKGAGLGLFIARKIVELHNGMIWAESKVGKGTTFRIQLPLD